MWHNWRHHLYYSCLHPPDGSQVALYRSAWSWVRQFGILSSYNLVKLNWVSYFSWRSIALICFNVVDLILMLQVFFVLELSTYKVNLSCNLYCIINGIIGCSCLKFQGKKLRNLRWRSWLQCCFDDDENCIDLTSLQPFHGCHLWFY